MNNQSGYIHNRGFTERLIRRPPPPLCNMKAYQLSLVFHRKDEGFWMRFGERYSLFNPPL